jgi:hypothetical protein
VNGADPKKIDTRSVILDFDIFQQMTDPSFIANLKDKTDSFLQKLIEHRETGKKNLINTSGIQSQYNFFFVDMSSSTTRCENTSSTVAVINTCDRNIKILLTLEVRN